MQIFNLPGLNSPPLRMRCSETNESMKVSGELIALAEKENLS